MRPQNIRTPVQASSLKSARPGGISGTRPIEMASRTMTAMTNRMATKDIGGRSRNPNLMASQVELQMRQSATNAAMAASLARCSGIAYHRIRSSPLQLLSRSIPRQRLDRVSQRLKSHQPDVGPVMKRRKNVQPDVAMPV